MSRGVSCPACKAQNPPGKERCGRCDRPLTAARTVRVSWAATTRDGVTGEGALVVETERGAVAGLEEVAQSAFWAAVEKHGGGAVRERVQSTMRATLPTLLPADVRFAQLELRAFSNASDAGAAPEPGVERIPALKWTGDGSAPQITLGALSVSDVRVLLSERVLKGLPARLVGAHKSVELAPIKGRRARSRGVVVDERTLRLELTPDAAQAIKGKLRPRCGEYRWPGQLPGLVIDVIESRIQNQAGGVARVVGWEPASGDEDEDEDEGPIKGVRRPAGWGRRVARALGVLLVGFAGLVGFASYYLRHVPYTIPPEWRAPPMGVGAALGTGLQLRYLGITGYELTDGKTTLLLDPTPTRPNVRTMISGPLVPEEHLYSAYRRADFILVNHTHHDHAMDVPGIALKTGAIVVGSQSTVNLARSRGVPADKTLVAEPGKRLRLGTFTVDVRASKHVAIAGIEEPMSGVVPLDAGPLWFWQYAQDRTLAYRLVANGTSVWFHPTSTYAPGELGGLRAQTLIQGVTGEDLSVAKMQGLIDECRPLRVLPTHYDNFFQPLSDGMALMPGLDLAAARAVIQQVAPKAEWWVLDFDQQVWLPPDEER